MIKNKLNGKISPDDYENLDLVENKSFSEFNSSSILFDTINPNYIREPKNHRVKSKLVTLNARGIEFKVPLDTCKIIPDSRLGKIVNLIENPKMSKDNETLDELCEKYDLKSNKFYFNSDPMILNMILNYLSTSKLHIDERVTLCSHLEIDEFKYWQIDEYLIENCCRNKFFNSVDDTDDKINDEKEIIKKYIAANNFGTRFFPKARAKVWQIIETKETNLSKVCTFFIVNCGQ